jgi:hypothetical protein
MSPTAKGLACLSHPRLSCSTDGLDLGHADFFSDGTKRRTVSCSLATTRPPAFDADKDDDDAANRPSVPAQDKPLADETLPPPATQTRA